MERKDFLFQVIAELTGSSVEKIRDLFRYEMFSFDPEEDFSGKHLEEFLYNLTTQGANKAQAESIFVACIARLRKRRYLYARECRGCNEPHDWENVVTTGFKQYLVSNWGFVRLAKKADLPKNYLKPSLRHEYARVGLSDSNGGKGGKQHMVHELVVEAFELHFEIPKEYRVIGRKNKDNKVINHLDGDKWNPAKRNLVITTQGKNLLHAYETQLRNATTK